uniref:Uncharacterized protein n=1 Tax=Rhizophora mucronata TaxID=61149 RepID=A0A2P2PLR0_RHIMU
MAHTFSIPIAQKKDNLVHETTTLWGLGRVKCNSHHTKNAKIIMSCR